MSLLCSVFQRLSLRNLSTKLITKQPVRDDWNQQSAEYYVLLSLLPFCSEEPRVKSASPFAQTLTAICLFAPGWSLA